MSAQASFERAPTGSGAALDDLLARGDRRSRVTHIEQVPARAAGVATWPDWLDPSLIEALRASGIAAPWRHQVEAAELAHRGHSVVVATGTASGKSLAYQLPVLHALLAGDGLKGDGLQGDGLQGRAKRSRRPLERTTALYLSPTKALAADQLRALTDLGLAELRAATYDGDTPREERAWIRAHANLVLANPDVLHRSMLPGHAHWAPFLRGLRYVVVDECHRYRGVFGSHVAGVLRRLRRIAARYGATPVFVLASATVSDPASSASRLVGLDVEAVTADGSPHAASRFVLWEPPLLPVLTGENGAPVRRSAIAESADLLADLVTAGVRTVAFVRSRRAAEAVSAAARRELAAVSPRLPQRVAAYRAGYLPEERRALEQGLRRGRLLGLATTSALELGIDVAGLDAVLLAGFPGTRASLWQQAGRAGRDGQESLAVLVARDDPLDTYLVHHPDALFGRPVEATVLDPDNPYVLGPQLAAAASESPLTTADLAMFGPAARAVVDGLVRQGLLRHRAQGWYWTRRERACDLADIRGAGGMPVRIVAAATGQLLGTANPATAHATVHQGALYVHQGEPYLVVDFDEEQGVALVSPADVDYFTTAREVTDVRLRRALCSTLWGSARLTFGVVDVTTQVVSFLRRRLVSGEVLGEQPLDLPPRRLRTRAVWWTVPDTLLDAAGLLDANIAGAAHAAEHASIGLLPLVATCDRWDVGGVSTARHQDSGQLTVVVYDGQPGGAGFAERGYAAARTWLRATRDAIAACGCAAGCPSCVQSPKCGNGNEPLDKAAALRLLNALLQGAPDADPATTHAGPARADACAHPAVPARTS